MPLHAHPDASTLLPLLRTQFPSSIVFVGTLLSNPSLAPVYANFPPCPNGTIDTAYLSTLGIGEYDWLVTVALPAPSEQQRVYHALSGAPSDVQRSQLARAEEQVCEAITEMMEKYPDQPVWGAVPELFGPAVRKLLDAPKRDTTYVYAPGDGWGASTIDAPDDLASLTFDTGRPEDGQTFHDCSGYRSLDYYRERSHCATVLRDSEGRVQVWVFTHGDGSIGALYTMPAYRRKGLAKAVLRRHVDRETQRGIPRYCYIEEDNDASAALFSSFGWTRLGGHYGWIYNSAALKREGKA